MREKIRDTIRMLDDAIKLIEEIKEEAKSNTFLTSQIEMLFSNVRVARQQLQYMSDFVPETKRGLSMESSRSIGNDSTKKGKRAEFYVFGELIKRGADLYLPVIDNKGIDAIILKQDGTYLQIQVKSTQEEEQAGYFNVYDLDEHPEKNFYIVCIDMNEDKAKVKGKPNTWILSTEEFKKYMVAGCRLPIYERSQKYGNKVRTELLQENFEAWELLIG